MTPKRPNVFIGLTFIIVICFVGQLCWATKNNNNQKCFKKIIFLKKEYILKI